LVKHDAAGNYLRAAGYVFPAARNGPGGYRLVSAIYKDVTGLGNLAGDVGTIQVSHVAGANIEVGVDFLHITAGPVSLDKLAGRMGAAPDDGVTVAVARAANGNRRGRRN
jgi:hypothetical protein